MGEERCFDSAQPDRMKETPSFDTPSLSSNPGKQVGHNLGERTLFFNLDCPEPQKRGHPYMDAPTNKTNNTHCNVNEWPATVSLNKLRTNPASRREYLPGRLKVEGLKFRVYRFKFK